MKIAQFITSMDDGGAESMVVYLSKELTPAYEVEVITFGNPHLIKKCEDAGVKDVTIPKSIARWQSIKFLPIFAWKFGKWLKSRNIDVLHSHLFKATLMGGVAGWLHKIPHVATQHDVYTIQEKPSRGKWLKKLSKRGTKIVVISNDMRSTFREICDIKYEDLSLVYNGVDTKKFYPQRKLYKTPDIQFAYIGRLERIKGVDLLIEEFKKFTDIYPTASLLLVGDGPQRGALEALVKECELKDKVLFLGRQPNIPKILRGVDCFTMASQTEGLSMSIIEAMSCGLPAVVTNVGGNYELVENGKNGYRTSRERIGDHAQAMLTFARLESDIKEEMGYNARRMVEARFSLSEMSFNYQDLYRRVSC